MIVKKKAAAAAAATAPTKGRRPSAAAAGSAASEAPVGSGKPTLRLVVKADVAGSEEAICQALAAFPQGKVCIDIIHSDIGEVTQADIDLAETTEGAFYGGLGGCFFPPLLGRSADPHFAQLKQRCSAST